MERPVGYEDRERKKPPATNKVQQLPYQSPIVSPSYLLQVIARGLRLPIVDLIVSRLRMAKSKRARVARKARARGKKSRGLPHSPTSPGLHCLFSSHFVSPHASGFTTTFLRELTIQAPHPMGSLRGGDDVLVSAFAQLDLVPRRGRLVPLRTKDEVRAALETFEAYVVELPARYAGVIKE